MSFYPFFRGRLHAFYLFGSSFAAGGWGALISVAQAWLTSDNALKNLRMMLKTNQNGGFDCPGCAWGDSPESGMVKFCENGAKAVNWEATKRRVDAKFFAKHSVTSLLEAITGWNIRVA